MSEHDYGCPGCAERADMHAPQRQCDRCLLVAEVGIERFGPLNVCVDGDGCLERALRMNLTEIGWTG